MCGSPRERSIHMRRIGKIHSFKFKPCPGESNGAAKLTAQAVSEIRRRYAGGGASQRLLAKEFGVHRNTIFAIVHKKLWPVEQTIIDAGEGECALSKTMPAHELQESDRPEAPAAEVLLGRVPAERRPRSAQGDASQQAARVVRSL